MQNACRVIKRFSRNFCTSSGYVLEQLNNRSLLRLSGEDVSVFLQGLITNDMQHLSHGAGSMYAMFLNNKGRVLYDTIIYRMSSDNVYYLEVDKEARDVLKKHLNVYRLRRKIDITSLDDQLKLWVHFNSNLTPIGETSDGKTLEGKIVPCSSLDKIDNNITTKLIDQDEIFIFRDPRLFLLGSRIIAPNNCDSKLIELYKSSTQPTYKWFRYRLGVGEGIEELPPGNCFPLEANCDYLHGVSFHKGCYIGQELTARTHHTGVVRKRLMPLIFNSTLSPSKDETVKSGDLNVGKLRGFEKDSGLGLLRIVQALEADKLLVDKTEASTIKPNWWPQEISKEKLSSRKI